MRWFVYGVLSPIVFACILTLICKYYKGRFRNGEDEWDNVEEVAEGGFGDEQPSGEKNPLLSR